MKQCNLWDKDRCTFDKHPDLEFCFHRVISMLAHYQHVIWQHSEEYTEEKKKQYEMLREAERLILEANLLDGVKYSVEREKTTCRHCYLCDCSKSRNCIECKKYA
jgi:hypothetical protein